MADEINLASSEKLSFSRSDTNLNLVLQMEHLLPVAKVLHRNVFEEQWIKSKTGTDN
jgi:hypothetical protein